MSLRRRYLLSGSNKSSVNDGRNYFSITALEDGLTAKLSDSTCEYCIDNGRWNKLSANSNTESINKGQTLYFKGKLTPSLSSGIGTFTISKKCSVQGNIMSLLYGGEFEDKNDLYGKNYAFCKLFYGCANIIDASNLELPATILSEYCYFNMFVYCTSLTTAPSLPATTLESSCYSGMFFGCSRLTTAPELPATTLANYCYNGMFSNCTSLTTAPSLPATTLAYYCYGTMFESCTSLTTAPSLPATTLESCCYENMFYGCNKLTVAPVLPATTLANYCYSGMFYNCSKLNYIEMLATDISATNCLYNWVYGVASSGTFVKNKVMTSLPRGNSGIPTGWVVEDCKEYFTIESLEDGLTVSFNNSGLEYSINNGVWNTLSSGVNTTAVNTGDKISFRGSNLTPTSSNGIGKFTIRKKCSVQGNIMSLLFGDDFKDKTDLTGYDYAFYELFYGCKKIIDAINLELPATTLSSYCYNGMFQGCNSLTTAPSLPATTLASSCYCYMFYGCSSLTTAPSLPATILTNGCYTNMFNSCTSLTTAPSLPATTLASSCYQYMFNSCTSLTTAPSLPATKLASYCYQYMFYGCTSLTTAPSLPATTLAYYCYGSMFYGCNSLTTSPELPATTLDSYCYYGMFQGCNSLTTAPSLPATILTNGCYTNMFNSCTSLTTAPSLPATKLASYCYQYMFYGCTGLNTAPELPATTLSSYCYSQMFYGCSSLTTSPELKATKLASYCYQYMFKGCNKLNHITMLATDISASGCLYNWVDGVASAGTFVKSPSMTSLPSGSSGIPTGWIVENYNPIDKDYFTIKSLEDGLTVSFSNSGLEYSINNGVWNSLGSGVNTTAANTGDKISFRGTLTPNTDSGIGSFTLSKKCSVQGNIMSLLYGDEFEDKTDLTGYDYAFYELFYGCANIIDASKLELPATTLSSDCYNGMFRGCNSLTTAPVLPATTLSSDCYNGMFRGCNSLTTAPILPATTLASKCYYFMFRGCISLTTAPALPVTTLENNCYESMFEECTGLTTAPELPATTLAEGCYSHMFDGCTGLTTAPSLPAIELAIDCYSGMFYKCSALTVAPSLPATTLAIRCYGAMFYNCSKLNHITMLATDISAYNCLINWVDGVASTGTFVKHPDMTSLPSGNSGIPTGWTVKDYNPIANEYFTIESLEDGLTVSFNNSGLEYSINNGVWNSLGSGVNTTAVNTGDKISFRGSNLTPTSSNGIGKFTISKKCSVQGNIMSLLFGDDFKDKTDLTGYDYAFYRLFYNNSVVLYAHELYLPAVVLSNSCYRQMFYYSYELLTTPELNASNLASNCYEYMFSNCRKIESVPELPAKSLVDCCYKCMFNNCHSLVDVSTLSLPATTLAKECYRGMFEDCKNLMIPPYILPSYNLDNMCYRGMFYNCVNLIKSPLLPSTKLANECYNIMFYNCSKLNHITMLATDISATSCLTNWVYGVASSGTFVKHPDMTSLPRGNSGIPTGWVVEDYNPNTKEYFTIESLEDGLTVSFNNSGLEYSINNGVWNTLSSGVNTTAVNTGDKISFRGSNLTPTSSSGIGKFTISKNCAVEGNIMSLLYGDEFEDKTDLTGYDYAFYNLFNGCKKLIDAINLILPATTLDSYCYRSMFKGCTGLTTAPSLPATTLAERCYQYMFQGCTGLNTAPSLPATTLYSHCYNSMFDGCTGLTVAPELPATTLAEYCYYYMFSGCTSLTTAPTLYAPTLTNSCYYYMFSGCNSLNKIKMLATDISATNCLTNWVNGVSSTGVFFKHKDMTSLPIGNSGGIPTGWTVEDMSSICEISLNNQWQLSTSVSNPDTSLYDGVYESFSNKGVNNTASIMYIDLYGLNDFTLYIRSYAESSYDYVMVSQLDKTIDNSTSYSNTTLIKAHTMGNQNSSTTISGYNKVDFTNIDGGKHRITVVYRKDSSSHSGDDRGYILIPKSYNSKII